MSLQVWLPLNGDLRNNGLCNCEISSNTGVTFNNDEWCSNFNNGCIFLHNPPILKMSYSFSFWFKYTHVDNKYNTIYTGRKDSAKHVSIFIYNKKFFIGNNGIGVYFSKYTITNESEWKHCIVIRNNLNMYLYINGELVDTITVNEVQDSDTEISYSSIGSSTNNSASTRANYLNGSLRDFRIYDHCLSVKEIKELSKGLILHYPFNNNGLGYCNPNLLTGTADGTGWVKTSFDEEEKALYRINNTTSENYIYYSSLNNIITIGKTYTFSADIKTNELVQSANMYVYDRNTKSIYKKDIGFRDNKWHHHKLTFTVEENNQADWSKAIIRFDNNGSKVEGQDAVLYVKNIKLEEGSIDTAWIPNEVDPEYLESLLDISIVNDTSGFGTYGIVNGDLSYDADSPVYRASIKSEANGNYIQGAKTLPNFDKMTLSFWINPLKSNTYCAFADLKSGLAFGIGARNKFICSIFSHNMFENTSSLIINQWNHIVVKKNDSSSVSLYINNQLISPISTIDNWGHSASTFRIFHRYNGASSYYTTGKLSDLRIYSTALSEDDIKELYKSKISVDKNGNVYIKNIIEE